MQAKEPGHHQRELKVSSKVPQVQSQTSSASAPTYTFQASSQRSFQSSRSRGKGWSKKSEGHGCGSASSGVTIIFDNPQVQTPCNSLPRTQRRVLAVVGMCVRAVRHSPREMCITSPPPQVRARLLQFYHEWVAVVENQFVLEVVQVRASLVFSELASAIKLLHSRFAPS